MHPRTKVKCWLPQSSRDLPNIRKMLGVYKCCLFFFSFSFPFCPKHSCLNLPFSARDLFLVTGDKAMLMWFCTHAKWLFILYRAHRTVLSNSVRDDICLWCVVKVLPFSDHTESRVTLQVDFTLGDALW